MKLAPNIEVIDLALFFPVSKTLVIGDVHLGFEEAANRRGIMLPRFQYKDTEARLLSILSKTKPRQVVIDGDLKHDFGSISTQEWREVLKLMDIILAQSSLVLVKGNHDIALPPIARKRKVKLVDHFVVDGIYITHGHSIPDDDDYKKSSVIVIGDEHPAVSIKDATRSELFKCFLVGKYKSKQLIVMPSFNLVTIGSDVLLEKFNSPFCKSLSNFDVYAVEDKVYFFGKVKDL